jgi:uncharacterized membrane protein
MGSSKSKKAQNRNNLKKSTKQTKSSKSPQVKRKIPPKIEYADFPKRIAAYIVDLMIVALPLGIMVTNIYGIDNVDLTYSLLLSTVAFFIYFFFLTWLNNGQSFGQYMFKIRVISADSLNELNQFVNKTDPRISAGQAAIHSIGKTIIILVFDTLIGIISKRGKQKPSRFLQVLANTIVIEKD